MSSERRSLMLEAQPLKTCTASTDDMVIRVQNVSKCYQLYDKPQDRLKQAIYPRVQRLLGGPSKHYARSFWALTDVSFDVKKGETLGIIGRNGSGKSTLLQIVCGTLAATTGVVETRGRVAALQCGGSRLLARPLSVSLGAARRHRARHGIPSASTR